MRELVLGVIFYALVPGILASMLVMGVIIAMRAESTHRISAFAGCGFGIMMFIIYVMMSGDAETAKNTGLPSVDGAWLPALTGLFIGFLVLWGVQRAIQLRAGIQGLITMFLTTTSSIAIFGYFYDAPLRNFTVFFAAGALSGMLLYFVFHSRRVVELLRKPASAR
ncbi:hypothetical protein OG205_23635 [Lentzea sp. NBC_00516]|uniref:hypothetical protein n=1 Tax=Lentzea sp. NBC_00516 TaxID=2903582 RepID=UPI002E80A27B|nr:hypothetical protein [Lentzea sp. NBC_00516]WUD21143.1 hypothetical protein OG205_23635 [Lentzea sp. NBC_00516]